MTIASFQSEDKGSTIYLYGHYEGGLTRFRFITGETA